jgi:hypothetical protein
MTTNDPLGDLFAKKPNTDDFDLAAEYLKAHRPTPTYRGDLERQTVIGEIVGALFIIGTILGYLAMTGHLG